MTPERAGLFAELLTEMVEQDNYWIPDQAYYPVHRAFALPVVEVVVVRRTGAEWEFFLSWRKDDEWDCWHIPGGHWRANQTLEEACNEVSLRELSVSVRVIEEVKSHKWLDHPKYPLFNAISHVVVCETDQTIEETPDAHFFSEIPDGIMINHGDFLRKVLMVLATR